MDEYFNFWREVIGNRYTVEDIDQNSELQEKIKDLVESSIELECNPPRISDLEWLLSSSIFTDEEEVRRKRILDSEIVTLKHRTEGVCTREEMEAIKVNKNNLRNLERKLGQLRRDRADLKQIDSGAFGKNLGRAIGLNDPEYVDIIGDRHLENVRQRIISRLGTTEGAEKGTLEDALKTLDAIIASGERKCSSIKQKYDVRDASGIKGLVQGVEEHISQLKQSILRGERGESLLKQCEMLEQAKTERVEGLREYFDQIKLSAPVRDEDEYRRRLDRDIRKVAKSLAIDSQEDKVFPHYIREGFGREVIKLSEWRGVHAEMKILEHMLDSTQRLRSEESLYIGLSKLCCRDCTAVVSALNRVYGKDSVVEMAGKLAIGEKMYMEDYVVKVRGAHLKEGVWIRPVFLKEETQLMENYHEERDRLLKLAGSRLSAEPKWSRSPHEENIGRRAKEEGATVVFDLSLPPPRLDGSTAGVGRGLDGLSLRRRSVRGGSGFSGRER